MTYSDKRPFSISGYIAALPIVALFLASAGTLLEDIDRPDRLIALFALVPIFVGGLYTVQPNTARVLTFLGKYAGTDKNEGLRWTLPLLIAKETVSVRLQNVESGTSKVNDAAGNPVEIAGITVWRVSSPATSVFSVEDVSGFVALQVEAALRVLANTYPYIAPKGEPSLQGDPTMIADALRKNIQDRVADAGVEIVEARISHLAYAPEIAGAMLQRQQANALLDAREVIVEGAVEIVAGAVTSLEKRGIVEFGREEKAALVNNLLVVLSSDQSVQPTLETTRSGPSTST